MKELRKSSPTHSLSVSHGKRANVDMLRSMLLLCLHAGWCAGANHYQALGIPRDASPAAVKSAYRAIALKHHPDRQPRSATAESRQRAQRLFEKANVAFECLSDPAQRRQYDFDLDHPIQEGDDGIFRRGTPGQTPSRPRVRVLVEATLEQLAGFEAATVTLDAWSTALGATVSAAAAAQLGLPMRIVLPPGSASGDVVYKLVRSLGPNGVDVEFVVSGRAHRQWQRKGDDLRATLELPAWHNQLPRPVTIRGVDGATIVLRRRGERVTSNGGASSLEVTVPAAGMPVAGSNGTALRSPRGDAHVTMRLRSPRKQLARTGARAAGVAACYVASARCVRVMPVVASTIMGYALAAADSTREVLENEVFGRARPQARIARARARSARRSKRQSVAQERERQQRAAAAKVRKQAQVRRFQAVWMPLRQKAQNAWKWAWE
jgi:DnaJ-class molecular chaperone